MSTLPEERRRADVNAASAAPGCIRARCNMVRAGPDVDTILPMGAKRRNETRRRTDSVGQWTAIHDVEISARRRAQQVRIQRERERRTDLELDAEPRDSGEPALVRRLRALPTHADFRTHRERHALR